MSSYRIYRQLRLESDGRCPLCRKVIDFTKLDEYLEKKGSLKTLKNLDVNIDHIVPKSHGGKNSRRNMQLVHKKCNIKKGNYKGIIHPVLTPWILD